MIKLHSHEIILGLIASILIFMFSGPTIVICYSVLAAFLAYKTGIKNYSLTSDFYVLLFFILWCIIDVYFAIDRIHALKYIAKFSIITISLYLVLDNLKRISIIPSNSKNILTMLIIVNIMMIIEHSFDFPMTRYLRSSISYDLNLRQPVDKASFLLSVIIAPILFGLYRSNILYWVLVVITIINAIINPVLAGTIAYFFSIMIVLACYYLGRRFIYLFFSAIILYLPTSFVIFKFWTNLDYVKTHLYEIPMSWVYRVQIWQKTIRLIDHKPWVGYGFYCSDKTNNLEAFQDGIFIQLHPHNIFLQLWLEMGAIGVGIMMIFLSLLFKKILAIKNQREQLSAIAMVSILFIYGNFSYAFWQSWLLCSIALAIIVHKMIFHIKED